MIDPTAAIDLLTKLVSIPSPSRHEAKASAYLAGWMNAHGFKAHVDGAYNAVGVRGTGEKEILLLGHIDTFPGEVPVRREGDLLYGRGSVDAKGPLCSFAAAAAQINVPVGWRVTVVGAVEEEAATSKGARYILSQRLETPPVYCLIGEPSHWDRVTLGYKGRLVLDIDLRVPFSHSAGEGRLPAEQAVDLWLAINRYCTQRNEEMGADSPFTRLDPALRHIASDDEGAFGTVAMSLGFRLPVGIEPATLEQDLRELLVDLPEGTTAEATFSGGEAAYKGDKSNPLVRAFLQAIRGAEGTPRFVVKTGTADMNVVAPHWPDTPIVAYGPGDSSLDHTPTEHIDVNEYLRAVAVLTNALQILMK
jgi:LysW-gamma-L-lysine carboxypeptidase